MLKSSKLVLLVVIPVILGSTFCNLRCQLLLSPRTVVDRKGYLLADTFSVIHKGIVVAKMDRWKAQMAPVQMVGLGIDRVFLLSIGPTGTGLQRVEFWVDVEIHRLDQDTLRLESVLHYRLGKCRATEIPYTFAISDSDLMAWTDGKGGLRYGVTINLLFYHPGDFDLLMEGLLRLRRKFSRIGSGSEKVDIEHL